VLHYDRYQVIQPVATLSHVKVSDPNNHPVCSRLSSFEMRSNQYNHLSANKLRAVAASHCQKWGRGRMDLRRSSADYIGWIQPDSQYRGLRRQSFVTDCDSVWLPSHWLCRIGNNHSILCHDSEWQVRSMYWTRQDWAFNDHYSCG
jgi:hypothetical protein